MSATNDSATDLSAKPTNFAHDGLWNRSFAGLLATQALGAFNDNMFRWLIVPIGKHLVAPEYHALVMSAGLACLVLPFVVLAAPAGYLADRFSKRSVMSALKITEVVVMLLGVGAIAWGNVWAMFAMVALMGAQSALFGPSKYGSIPELVPPHKLAAANGLVGMTTIVAVVLGTIAGLQLYEITGPAGTDRLWISGLALVGVAGIGWLTSLLVAHLPQANPGRAFPRRPVQQTVRDLGLLFRTPALARAALGSAFFWGLAGFAQMNLDRYGLEELGLRQAEVGTLLGILAAGVAVGNVLAARWSRGKVELGLVPVGAAGMVLASVMLAVVSSWYYLACSWLLLLGTSAGLFDVPLQAYLQERSPRASRGSLLAAANFLTFVGSLASAGLFALLQGPLEMSASSIFWLCGAAAVPVCLASLWLVQDRFVRCLFDLLRRLIYRVRVEGELNLPASGGALLVANHVSWIDGILLLLVSHRPIRMVAYADYVDRWWLRSLARRLGVIPVSPGAGPRSIRQTLTAAREALGRGELVCIFPEGGITRSGATESFQPGALAIVNGTGAPMIPVYLDGLWGSIFSYQGGKFFWKKPVKWPYPLSIRFGEPLSEVRDIQEVRRAVEELKGDEMQPTPLPVPNLLRQFVRECRRSRSRVKASDSTGRSLTGGKLLAGTLAFRRMLRREVLSPDEKFVGVLVPPSVGAILCNTALPMDQRVAVNLNYTVSPEVMNSCIRQCGIRHVLTTKRMMTNPVTEKLMPQIDAELVFLEDLATEKVRRADKLLGALAAYACPTSLLERLLGLHKIQDDDLMTVLFTSGSTGEPKGVMLTHRNVAANVYGIAQHVPLNDRDCAVGVMPFFHSYGYTATLWTMLSLPPSGIYHFSPLDAKIVGQMVKKHRATILMATPTFLRSYMKRCDREDLQSLEVVFASAEKLPKELSDAFERKFGVRPLEAYGATELAPLVSVNVPPSRTGGREMAREGSVGKPVWGVQMKLIDPDTGESPPPAGKPGLLYVAGPTVMKGYYNKAKLTAEALHDGWYATGDLATVDEDGFLFIRGRQSRFSKIGGEMVPHIKIEETIQRVLSEDEDELLAAVTAVPDSRKGERLVVIHVPLEKPVAQICRELAERGLPNLWIPGTDSFYEVPEIPVLGTGKLDLKRLKDLAMERAGLCAGASH